MSPTVAAAVYLAIGFVAGVVALRFDAPSDNDSYVLDGLAFLTVMLLWPIAAALLVLAAIGWAARVVARYLPFLLTLLLAACAPSHERDTPTPQPEMAYVNAWVLATPEATPSPSPSPLPATPEPAAVSPQPAQVVAGSEVQRRICQAWRGDCRWALRTVDCESEFDPRAFNAAGPFYGLWQFTQSTWEWMGGSGDPRDASVEEQTQRAWQLFLIWKRGKVPPPWPRCGVGH